MASNYKTNIRRFNGVDYDKIYPATTADVVKYDDNTTLEDNRTKSIIVEVPAESSWSGEYAPYTCTINSLTDITVKTNGIIGIAAIATEEERNEAEECGVRLTSQGNGNIVLSAKYRKPTISFPLEIIITGVNP